MIAIGLLTFHLQLPLCKSLKDKRSRIQPILNRLHREFNVTTAEIDKQDNWHEAVITCALISNDNAYTQKALSHIASCFSGYWPDIDVLSYKIEII